MTPTLHRCTSCRERKPASEFHKDRKTSSGLRNSCIACNRDKQRLNSKRQWEKQKAKYSAMINSSKPDLTAKIHPISESHRNSFLRRFSRKRTPNPPKPVKALQKRTVGQRKPARRTRIRAVSEKKQEWNDLYRLKYEKDTLFGVVYDLGWDGDQPVVLRKLGSRAGYERHHPAARNRYHILAYVYVSHALHEWCHGNGKAARAIGALLPEFDGRESGPDQLDPFSVLPQIQELRNKYEL